MVSPSSCVRSVTGEVAMRVRSEVVAHALRPRGVPQHLARGRPYHLEQRAGDVRVHHGDVHGLGHRGELDRDGHRGRRSPGSWGRASSRRAHGRRGHVHVTAVARRFSPVSTTYRTDACASRRSRRLSRRSAPARNAAVGASWSCGGRRAFEPKARVVFEGVSGEPRGDDGPARAARADARRRRRRGQRRRGGRGSAVAALGAVSLRWGGGLARAIGPSARSGRDEPGVND